MDAGTVVWLIAPHCTRGYHMEEMTILELQEAMALGTHTARSLAEMYLERIEKLDA